MTQLSLTKIFIWLLFVAFIITGCIYGKKDFNTKPTRRNFNINAIKLNGIYVGKQTTYYESILCFIFYNNGVVKLYDPIFYLHEIQNKDSVRQQVLCTIQREYRNMKEGGGFEIKNKIIRIQVFRTDASIGTPSLCEYQGRILNDTTIHIDKCNYPTYPNWCRQDFDLHFIKIAKPDSTNKFMKKNWFWTN